MQYGGLAWLADVMNPRKVPTPIGAAFPHLLYTSTPRKPLIRRTVPCRMPCHVLCCVLSLAVQDVVRTLLESGADPQLKDNFGNTATYEAVTMGFDDVLDVLLNHNGS